MSAGEAAVPEEKLGKVAAVLNWLRAGYPLGVPSSQSFPLLSVLYHRLTPAEIEAVVADLRSSGHLSSDEEEITAAIQRISDQQPSPEDVERVEALLAEVGPPPVDTVAAGHGHQSLLQAMIGWLRAGYPEGVPSQDYVPLLALMRRRLSDEEIVWVTGAVMRDGPPPFGTADIGVLITKVTNELPSEEDIERVRARLAATGWPVDPL